MSAPSDWHSRDSSPSAARSVSRAGRTLPELRGVRSALTGPLLAAGRQRATGRVRTAAGALARVVVLGGHRRDEPMEARLAGELGVERGGDDVALPDGHDPAVVEPGQDVDLGAGPLDDRGADEDAMDRRAAEDRDVELRLERVELAPERIALDGHVEERQDRRLAAGDLGGQHDHPGTRPEDRRAALGQVEDRVVQAPALDELAHRRALATGQDQPADVGEIGRFAHANPLHADGAEGLEVFAERPLEGEDPDPHVAVAWLVVGAYQPLTARRSSSGIASSAIPRIGAPSPLETSAIFFGSSKKVVAWTIAFAIRAGSSLLKMPEPTKTPSAPSCMTSAASAGVLIPPATKLTTGSFPVRGDILDQLVRRAELLGRHEQLVLAQSLEAADLGQHVAQLADGLDDVAGPGLALGPHHRGALVDPAQGFAEVAAAAHERDLEGVLVDVVALVGRREHLRLVDVVDAERLEDLRLDEMTDARLGHDRDGDRVHDPLDHRGIGHAGHAAGCPDIGRDALERHHGDGAGILGDLGLVGGDDVHDDAALEHLGETGLGCPGRRFDGHVSSVSFDGSRSDRRPGLAPRSSPVRVGRAPRAR